MQLSALSYAFLLFAGISAVFGLVTGKTELFAAAAGCIAVPAVGIFGYLGEVKKQIASLIFSRKVDAVIVRQNGDVTVSAQLTPEYALSSSVTFEDLLPDGAYITRGNTQFESGKADYTFTLPAAGKSYFRGIKVTAACLFGTFTFTIVSAKEPQITAYPTGTAAFASPSEIEYSDRAHDRYAIIPTAETRDFRAYYPGDDMRYVDWKQTLHRDKLYIRQMMDSQVTSPLLILDLPDVSASAEETAAFVETAAGAIKFCRGFDEASAAFICKGNLIELFPLKESGRVAQNVLTAGKREASVHLFRERHKHSLISWKNLIGGMQSDTPEKADSHKSASAPCAAENPVSAGASSDVSAYHQQLIKILETTAKRADGEFERQSKRLFLQKQSADFAIIVSTAAGDISHLLYLIHDASTMIQDVSVNLSCVRSRPDCAELVDKLRKAGASRVEAVS
ncbi:MAG TPA: DUF58 domain-containing protein [Methanocorpusculum sp.]|nr:DUF58 domain-containing protein [Methanocorpusculum sp.]